MTPTSISVNQKVDQRNNPNPLDQSSLVIEYSHPHLNCKCSIIRLVGRFATLLSLLRLPMPIQMGNSSMKKLSRVIIWIGSLMDYLPHESGLIHRVERGFIQLDLSWDLWIMRGHRFWIPIMISLLSTMYSWLDFKVNVDGCQESVSCCWVYCSAEQ